MKVNWSKLEILKLSLINNISTQNAIRIISTYSNFEDFSQSSEYSKYLGNNSNLFQNDELQKKYDLQLEFLESKGKRNYGFVTYYDDNYPKLLSEINEPPLVLYYFGNFNKITEKAAAVVGTRHNTLYGKLTTENLVQFLSNNQISVISGLAYGIDTIAHLNTIRNNGHTVAVIASGLDKLSPSTSVKNAESIVENGGAIITSFEFGRLAKPQYFLLRNRIICGMSKTTIVVESAKKGGSLWTARFANDYNREVFAIPGNINSEKSIGTNRLIKDNLANMLIDFDDLLEHYNIQKQNSINLIENVMEFENPNWKLIYDKLSYEPIQIDTLSNDLEMTMSMLLVNLLEMEFEGVIRQLPGKYYIKS